MITDELVENLDADSARYTTERVLELIGSEGSRFLRGIRAKARKLGFSADIVQTWPKRLYVVDVETVSEECAVLYSHQGIDSVPFPAVEQAVLKILDAMNEASGKHVVVVGRGNFAKDLPERLVRRDSTVTICHSKTADMRAATAGTDVLILATPVLPKNLWAAGYDVVIDMSGCAEGVSLGAKTYIGSRDLGRLTTSIIVNRFAHRYGKEVKR